MINIVIIIAGVSGALLFLFLVTRTTTVPSRKESNDFTGAVVAVIGTTYAVILAFTLAGVWNMFQEAQANEEQEANSLVNVYRIASQLPDANARAIQDLCGRYAENALDREWPAMLNRKMPPEGGEMINQFWTLAGQAQARAPSGAIAAYQLMEELRGLTQYRRIRATQNRETLPFILWAILISGGIVTVVSACFFGVANFRIHVLQVFMLSFLISLVLVAIANIDRPYQGPVRVTPEGFRYALNTLHQQPSP
jgi:ABC-type branched-subunit amino acid transport system permease subunit